MKFERTINTENREFQVVLSDEKETLLAAQAAGRVIVGLADSGKMRDLGPARYVYQFEAEDEIPDFTKVPDEEYLERIVRRSEGLPWKIAETKRLQIRELTMEDRERILKDPEDTQEDRVFQGQETLQAYIREQYGFYECGMWAVIEKGTDTLVGLAGITPSDRLQGNAYELGYHIFTPFRQKGYAKEACRAILHYCAEEYEGQAELAAYVRSDNAASIHLLEQLGFERMPEVPAENSIGKCIESEQWLYRFVGSC